MKTTINQIGPDTDIDRDSRVLIYDNWLLDRGFKYIETRMSSSGGIRQYKHPKNIIIEVMRQPGSSLIGLQWYMMRASDWKELDRGDNFTIMTKNIEKLL